MRSVPVPRLLHRCVQALLLLAVLAATGWWAAAPPAASPGWRPLAHWRGDGRDWLLVADAEAGRVAIYDARDGRPLGTLGRMDGLAVVRALAVRGDTLWVSDGASLRRVQLPGRAAPEGTSLALAGRRD